MKPRHLILTLLTLLVSINASADEWTDANGTVWSFSISGNNATLYNNQDYKACIRGIIPQNLTIPSSVYRGGLTYSVTSIGNHAFYDCSGLTSITIPNSVTSIGVEAFHGCSGLTSITIPNSVTSIGNYAFYNCSGLTSVTIPESVTSIGDNAFMNCSGLTSVTIPNSVTSIGWSAFSGCSGLTSVTIPESVTSIGKYAFHDCSGLTSVTINSNAIASNITDETLLSDIFEKRSVKEYVFGEGVKEIGESACYANEYLTSVTIPNSVTSIGCEAFYGCSGLTSVTIPESVTSIGDNAFSRCGGLTSIEVVSSNTKYDSRNNCNAIIETSSNELIVGCENTVIPESVTSIGGYAFMGCSGLTSVTIPNSVTSIGMSAFYGCSGLTSVTIPNSVTSIGMSAFYGCSGLTSVTIPESVTSIGDNAFSRCTGLTSVTIPNSVTSIGYQAFYNCSGLTSVTIPNSVTSIGYQAFYNCSGLTSITIPNSVTSIGSGAFSGCSGVTSITIPNSVKSIGDNVFKGCTGLTSVNIPESVTSIGGYAFKGCTGLTSVNIPESVTSIGFEAFSNCSGLTSVAVENPTPVTVSSTVFSNRANATLIVPVGSKAAYEAANYWKEFKRIIEFIEGDVNGDGEMDVVDVVDIARYVVGTPAETFVQILADINNNGDVNLGDAVSLVNMIAGDQNFVKAQRAPQRVSESEETLMLKGADNNLSLVLQNTHKYTAFQFDLYVPDGVDVASMLLNAQRKQKHQLLYNKVEDGHWRVTAFSTSNRSFDGNDGELLAIVLDGIASDDISICNIHFFTADGGDYEFDDLIMQSGIVTDIDSPSMSPATVGDESIYTLDGRRVSGKPQQKGIYIVNGKKIVKR